VANLLFTGTIALGATQYVLVPIRNGALGAHIAWKDATSSTPIALELSSCSLDSGTTVGAAWEWEEATEVTITGPNATAIGSTTVNVENVRQSSARLRIGPTIAATTLEVRDGTA
jgi:hypothetical protein